MILFFNKQYRAENNMINDLAKKIKKSKVVEREIRGNTEVYKLDNMVISFDILGSKLTVEEKKTGEAIVDMDCKFGGNFAGDELQNARFDMFSNLLEVARKRYKAHIEKAEKMNQASKKLQEKQAQLSKVETEKAAAEAAIVEARKKLKSL